MGHAALLACDDVAATTDDGVPHSYLRSMFVWLQTITINSGVQYKSTHRKLISADADRY